MRALIRGYLDSVYVKFNGDASDKPGQREKDLAKTQSEIAKLKQNFKNQKSVDIKKVTKFDELWRRKHELENDFDNMLVVTLVHPDEDGDVELIKALPLGNGYEYGYKPDSDEFLTAGLFKKIAIGEFGIRVAVTDTDEAIPFAKFLRRVFVGIFNSIVKTPIGEISNVIVSNTAQQLWSDGGKFLEKNGDKITVVAVSKTAKFKIDEKSGDLTCTNQNKSQGITYSASDGVLKLELSFPEMIKVSAGKSSETKYRVPGSSNGIAEIRLESVKL